MTSENELPIALNKIFKMFALLAELKSKPCNQKCFLGENKLIFVNFFLQMKTFSRFEISNDWITKKIFKKKEKKFVGDLCFLSNTYSWNILYCVFPFLQTLLSNYGNGIWLEQMLLLWYE